MTYKTVPLYRWDAYVTHYDLGIADPKALVEQIAVYRTHVPDDMGDPLVQSLIESLKKRLSE